MKIYIVKEDYTCEVEDASGESREERHDRIVGVSLTLNEAREMVRRAIADNCEEYYTVDESDYQIIEAEPGYERWRYVNIQDSGAPAARPADGATDYTDEHRYFDYHRVNGKGD